MCDAVPLSVLGRAGVGGALLHFCCVQLAIGTMGMYLHCGDLLFGSDYVRRGLRFVLAGNHETRFWCFAEAESGVVYSRKRCSVRPGVAVTSGDIFLETSLRHHPSTVTPDLRHQSSLLGSLCVVRGSRHVQIRETWPTTSNVTRFQVGTKQDDLQFNGIRFVAVSLTSLSISQIDVSLRRRETVQDPIWPSFSRVSRLP
jgi:hypothetical protein